MVKNTKKQTIPKKLKELVWDSYIGNDKGKGLCQCCRKESISQMSFHCGHIISEFNKGECTISNLKPICALCNLSMGKMNMDEYMVKIGVADKKYTKKKNKKYSQVMNDTNNSTHLELDTFLTSLSIKQLRQLCRSLSTIDRQHNQISNNISPNGTKKKIVEKIIKQGYTLVEIKKMIEEIKNSKYFIMCCGPELKKCDNCTYREEFNFLSQCENCDESHAYYTNTKLSDAGDVNKTDYVLILKKRNKKCPSCKHIACIDEYLNSFYVH